MSAGGAYGRRGIVESELRRAERAERWKAKQLRKVERKRSRAFAKYMEASFRAQFEEREQ